MSPRLALASVAVVAAFLAATASCSTDRTPPAGNESAAATIASVVGTWVYDHDATVAKEKASDAYKAGGPEDRETQEAEFEAFKRSNATMTFGADTYEYKTNADEGSTVSGTYKVLSSKGSKVTIEIIVDGKRSRDVLHLEGDAMTVEGDGPMIYRRQS